MDRFLKFSAMVLIAAGLGSAAQAFAQTTSDQRARSNITFYDQEGYGGRWFSTDRRIGNFNRYGFNDAADSVKVRGGRWEVCTAPRFEGRCVVLRRGDYPSLRQVGLEDSISSARPLQRGNRYWNERSAYDRQPGYDRR